MEDNNFKQSITAEEIEKLPFSSFGGKIEVIEHPGFQYTKALAFLRKQKVIGFDTETRPCFEAHHLHHDVALLQLSSEDRAFLFRLNKLGLRRSLCTILSNPDIIKVGAACHDDIRALQRLRFFKPGGFVDLQRIVEQWGISDKSVKKMSANILGIRISKNQQLSNWEADVLTQAQQLYGATDAWVCREMYLKLRNTQQKALPENE
ncbi:MAG: 3'-5' exonuclease [Candidatus Cryptobacteroides sp.]